jgi:alpha-tubulin suppressor-like RCC1 family protein
MLDGSARCWGFNFRGQLGAGTPVHRGVPADVKGLTEGVVTMSAGLWYTCILTDDGNVRCMGFNDYGQLGDGTFTDRSEPVIVDGLDGNATAIGVGKFHACATMVGGGVKCWGHWSMCDYTKTPVDITGLESGVAAIGASEGHTCALMDSGGVKCWGDNLYSQLGIGGGETLEFSTVPTDVNGLTTGAMAIATGGYHACALVDNAPPGYGVKCWGHNAGAELGDGTFTNRDEPVDVNGLSGGVTAVAAGWGHTCALVASGKVKCWGEDAWGQLGLGTVTLRLTPVEVVAYTPLDINYTSGQPDSFFTLTGASLPSGTPVTVTVNGTILTDALTTTETGETLFVLDSTQADRGFYLVTTSANPGVQTAFILNEGIALRELESSGTMLVLPAGIAHDRFFYLPLMR